MSLYSDDLVMRTSTSIFHYSCFSCSICGSALQQGDEYKIRGSQIVCNNHFNKMPDNSVEALTSGVHGKKYAPHVLCLGLGFVKLGCWRESGKGWKKSSIKSKKSKNPNPLSKDWKSSILNLFEKDLKSHIKSSIQSSHPKPSHKWRI